MKTALVILALTLLTSAQSKPPQREQEPSELVRLRSEFIQATKDYKASLEKLLASYEKNVASAEKRLSQSRELYAQGLISIEDVKASERNFAEAQDKVKETRERMANSDKQITETLNDSDQIAREYKKAVAKRASARGRSCPNWKLTAYRRETKRSVTMVYKFVCL